MNEKNRVLDIDIERYALGELPADRIEMVEAALKASPEAEAMLAAIEADNAAILADYPPRLMAVRIAERARTANESRVQSRRRFLVPLMSATVAAAAAVAVMLVLPRNDNRQGVSEAAHRDDREIILTKGKQDTPSLLIFRKTGQTKELLSQGAVASAGDLVQLKYLGNGRKHGVIFSVDGRGAITLHYPQSENQPTVLEKKAILPSSIELDDAPEFERFFFVTSDKPIDVADILGRARGVGATGDLALSKDYKTSDFLLKKN